MAEFRSFHISSEFRNAEFRAGHSFVSGDKRHREDEQDSRPDDTQCMPEPFRERHAPKVFMVVSIREGRQRDPQ